MKEQLRKRMLMNRKLTYKEEQRKKRMAEEFKRWTHCGEK